MTQPSLLQHFFRHRRKLLNVIWVFSCALLALIGYVVDREQQNQRFEITAATLKSQLLEVMLTTSEELRLSNEPSDTQYDSLIQNASNLTHSTLFEEAYLITRSGEFFSTLAGNPEQNFVVTEDDTDYAAQPKLVKNEAFWRHYFLFSPGNEPRIWPNTMGSAAWLMTIAVDSVQSQERRLYAFTIDPTQLIENSEYPNIALFYEGLNTISFGRWSESSSSAISSSITPHWSINGTPQLPILALAYPVLFSLLMSLALVPFQRGSEKTKPSAKQNFYPIFAQELNIAMFETDLHSKVLWIEGQVPDGFDFLDFREGDHVREKLSEHPRYLTYWQHSLSGEKLTYEVEESSHCLRIHQWPQFDENGHLFGLSVFIQDITEQRNVENQLQHQQYHDDLTGLPNRQLFMEQIQHELHRAKRRQEYVAVLALELSGIGHINKIYGHKTSDSLLKLVTQSLAGVLRSEDTLSRFSNDEFLISFNDYRRPDELQAVAQRLIEKATQSFELDNHSLNLFANVGIATYPRDARDAGSLVSNAITAMRHARQTGRNSLDYFSADNARLAHEKWQLEKDITKAINAHDFTLHYQPIFNLENNKCIGAEALIRWPATNLTPDQFIPLAEETGLITPIGNWVLETAIDQFFAWKNSGSEIQYISVNLSVLQLTDEQFFRHIDTLLERYPIKPGDVTLEITESVMMQTSAAMVEKLNRLRELGFHLAIDDFGTGFSSLNYLKHLPVNYLKVDRGFVSGVPDSAHDTAICEAIIQMALAMDLELIAEGVETPNQMAWLSDHGVLAAQGYFYARAVDAEAFKPYLGIE